MAKWADFLISAVRYSADGTHIERVRVHEDLGDKVGSAKESSRTEVVENIKSGKSYITILKGQKGWKKGQDVHIITVQNKEFIRTDKNQIASDNLENLPTF
jgi:hypothetical protein